MPFFLPSPENLDLRTTGTRIASMPNSDLSASVRRLARVHAPAEVFSALLEGSEPFAERVALLLVKGGSVRGWGASSAFPAADRATWRNRTWDATEGWWPALLDQSSGEGMIAPMSQTPDLGTAAKETWGIPILLGDRPVALLVAQADRLPIERAALCVLAIAAQIRLELDLYKRRLEKAEGLVPGVPAPAPAPVAPVRPAPPVAPAASPTAAPAPRPAPSFTHSDADVDDLEPVRRFARLIATDIRLYNEEAVVSGRKDGNLANRLQEPMRQGKQTFLQRYGDLGDDAMDILNDAFVQVLAGGDSALIGT